MEIDELNAKLDAILDTVEVVNVLMNEKSVSNFRKRIL